MHWESQSGRFPRDPRLGHRTGRSYTPSINGANLLKDLYSTPDGFISNVSSSRQLGLIPGHDLIIILGGSVAMGLGASRNETTISAVLENKLKQTFGDNICVLNAACAAYCSWQEFIKFSLELSRLKPKYVVSISSWNDFVHSSIGDRYTGNWTCNHDRSIDDLSDKLIGLDEKVSLKNYIPHLFAGNKFTKRLIRLYLSLIKGAEINDDEIRWGYQSVEYKFREDAVFNYIHNMSMINSIAQGIGSNFTALIQPWLTVGGESTNASLDLSRIGKLHKNFFLTRNRFHNSLHASIDHEFMLNSPELSSRYFVDHCHLWDEGQRIMANFISEVIKSKLK